MAPGRAHKPRQVGPRGCRPVPRATRHCATGSVLNHGRLRVAPPRDLDSQSERPGPRPAAAAGTESALTGSLQASSCSRACPAQPVQVKFRATVWRQAARISHCVTMARGIRIRIWFGMVLLRVRRYFSVNATCRAVRDHYRRRVGPD